MSRAILTCLIAGGLLATSALAAEPLRWGADKEGGAPFVFFPDEDPTRLIGFEYDLANALGQKLQRPAKFVQQNWDSLLPSLRRGDFDLALNGYEFTPDRAEQYLSSIPYYVYDLSLTVKSDASLKGWADLRKPGPKGRKWIIGVLEESLGDRYCTEEFGATAEIRRYSGSTEGFLDTANGRLDVTVQDTPAAQYYVVFKKRFPTLTVLSERAAPGYYVTYGRAEGTALMNEVNAALKDLYASGELKRIYDRYGIWNEAQTTLPEVWKAWPPKRTEGERRWDVLGKQVPILLRAAVVTVELALLAMPLAILIGLIAGLARTWHTPALGGTGHVGWGMGAAVRWVFTVYVEVIRGTPLFFQLWIIYFVLPNYGVTMPPFWAGVAALAINYSAYEAEIIRLGIQAIPRGQMEAALSLGMSRFLAIRRIILPQSIRMVIPATANDFIALFKDTAVCSVISVEELAKQSSMGGKSTGYYLEVAAMASILYLVMSYPLSLLAGWLERRLKRQG